MCGKNISSAESSTIGEQRRTNYALKPMERDEFVSLMTAELPPMPAYFPVDAELNRHGAQALTALPTPSALDPDEFEKLAASGALMLDVRSAEDFGAGHIPGSLNIGLGGQFASWAGSLITVGRPLLLVVDDELQSAEAVMRLARVGHETVRGYLQGGVEAWRNAGRTTASIPQISVGELANLRTEQPDLQVLDVRRPTEYRAGHVPEAVSGPLDPAVVAAAAASLDPSKPTAVICAGGYRSSAAASLLEQAGFENLLNVTGGTNAWIKAGLPVVG